ncbi:type I restriction enzyme HsdR N-terminal domain-containing protein [Haloarcula rubripromontorii]|uniref:type I restriction enzyme HsdR N-terminal domain-containing protein n=1 Tax=Haloarcula rubripromontorii TaxID=1705562 RepID=UPI001F0F34BE|nr:type I restriction enzyme HsdR N-terminal domain-containing protein [Haloarcula rubripromontorii]
MDRDEIDEYVQRCQQLIEASPQMDEENTKVKLIQPFLELLGWDLYSTEVALEYTIPMASGSTHVDYALLVGDSPVVFVEAKPVRSTLTDSEVQQLRSYMRQELDVDWGILTNGKSFEVLTKNHRDNGGEEVSVVQFSLDDLADNPSVLELLTKESIRSGKSDEVAEQVAETNRAIRYLQENEDSVTEAVTEAVEAEVGELTIDLEEQSREFTQNLVSVLREQRQFVSEESPSEPDKPAGESEGSKKTTADKSTDSKNTGEGYIVRFSDGKEIPEVKYRPQTQQKLVMGAAIDYLIQEYNLIEEIEIPHFPPKARKNCSINIEPVHPNGEDMRIPYELTNGYHLHTSLNVRGKQSRIRDLAEQVGLSVEFLGEW